MQDVKNATHRVITPMGKAIVVRNDWENSKTSSIRYLVLSVDREMCIHVGDSVLMDDGVLRHNGKPRHDWRLRAL